MLGTRVHFTYHTPRVYESFPFDVEGQTRADLAAMYAQRYAQFGEVTVEESTHCTKVYAGTPATVYACVVLTDVQLHRHPRKVQEVYDGKV